MAGDELKHFLCVISMSCPDDLAKSDLQLCVRLTEARWFKARELAGGGSGCELRLQSTWFAGSANVSEQGVKLRVRSGVCPWLRIWATSALKC